MSLSHHVKKNEDRTKRILRLSAILGAFALAAAGCAPGGPGNMPVTSLNAKTIQTEAVTKHLISSPIEVVADVTAGAVLDVIPKAGGQVTSVLKKAGDRVKKGDVLFTLDDADAVSNQRKSDLSLRNAQQTLTQTKENYDSNHKDLQDSVTRAETAYRNALQEYNKTRNDFDDGVATERQVEQAEDNLNSAKLSLESAKQKLSAFEASDSIKAAELQVENAKIALEDANRALENYQVKAPGDGVLTDFHLVVGQTVAMSASVGQIQQIDPIKIKTDLTETNYALAKGKKELVYYDPDQPDQKGKAAVSYLAPIMSATTKTYALELEVPNPDLRLQPGKRFMVQLTTETEEQVLAVQTLSVVREESDSFVFVEQGDHYEKRKVTLGRINGEYQEVLAGLKEGEKVVISGQNTMKDGQKVESQPAQGQPSASPEAKK